MMRHITPIIYRSLPKQRILKVNNVNGISFQGRGFSSRPLKRLDSEMARLTSIELVPSLADDPQELARSLSELQAAATSERVPWFQENMPSAYFRQVPRERRLNHLVSVAAVPDMNEFPEIVSYDHHDNGVLKTMAIIASGHEKKGVLENRIMKLPESDKNRLSAFNLYTSKDKLITITEFIFADRDNILVSDSEISSELKDYAANLRSGKFDLDREQYFKNSGEILHANNTDSLFTEDNLKKFAGLTVAERLEDRISPRRLCKFIEMYDTLMKLGPDEVLLDIESNWSKDKDKVMYTLAMSNVLLKNTMARIVKYLEFKGMEIERCHLDRFEVAETADGPPGPPEYNDVSFVRFLVSCPDMSSEFCKDIKDSLPLVSKWYGDSILKNYYKHTTSPPFHGAETLKLVDYEVAVGLLECVHLVKSGTQMYEYSKPNVLSLLSRPQMFELVNIFKKRFDPQNKFDEQDDAKLDAKLKEIRNNIDQYIEIDLEREVLYKTIDILRGTSRTNLYRPNRFGFSIKLDPQVCMDPRDTLRTTVPFGVFFVSGRRFTGLQLRFREIARGGLRLVTPNSPQALTIESTRQFAECYDLAFAQQQKNKDIAEGGSKAVCLIDVSDSSPHAPVHQPQDRNHILRKCVKSFVNSILDLITINDANKVEELIFLGPDEQITIEHINWIIRRAGERNYRMPSAFMSSKPDQGINHKEFGVTSEGVQVFLDVAIKNLEMLSSATNKTNKDFFTVKITGGPDGDVAGNMLKILHREYGDKCRVVGIADGTGCVEDEQNGIAWEELLRLVKISAPLSSIDKTKLSKSTKVYTLEHAEGVQKRNTLHNRIKADAFIPGGGRPATINEANWERFMHEENGKLVPSSSLIVEGANLFLTNFARERLAEHGCVIIKDSSANKCGVICSSFEIMSSMLLDKQQFIAIKPKLVPQVLDKLRYIARREAELLMAEYRRNTSVINGKRTPFNLVAVSIDISHAINRATDCVRAKLENVVSQDKTALEEYMPLVKEFLPDELVKAGWKDIKQRIPEVYLVNLVSTILACELVYNEGIDFVAGIKDDKVLADTAMSYISARGGVRKIIENIRNGQTLTKKENDKVARLLELGGPRAALLAGGIDKL